MNPYTIDDWNELLRVVNVKLQDPPSGESCQPVDTIEEVSDPHIWSVDDVQAVRDKLIETCDDISFSEPLEIWRQEIIDEILLAIDQTWCDCCDDEFLHSEDGLSVDLGPHMGAEYIADIVIGLEIGKPGIKLRLWDLYVTNEYGQTRKHSATGTLSCEGLAEYYGNMQVKRPLPFPGFVDASYQLTLVVDTTYASCQDC
jgi:hypothetical protein